MHLRRIVDRRGDGADKGSDVVGRNELSRLRSNELSRLRSKDLRNTADVSGDNRKSGGGGLQHYIGQRLGTRRDDEHATHGEGYARRTMADEANLVIEPKSMGLRLQFHGLRTFAG